MTGAGFELNGVIVNGLEGEDPPPGEGFETVTLTVPAEANALAAIATVTWVWLTKVVGCAPPFSCTIDSEKNPDPFTFNITGAAPACTLAGVIDDTEGTGLLTKKLTESDGDGGAPGLVTKTVAKPAALNKDDGATAVIFVLLTNVAPNCVGVAPAAFQVTVAFARKFEPVKVSIRSDDPTVTLLGEIEAIAAAAVGGGGNCSFELPPPQLARANITMYRAQIENAANRQLFMLPPVMRNRSAECSGPRTRSIEPG
jgi:hypothetical protein